MFTSDKPECKILILGHTSVSLGPKLTLSLKHFAIQNDPKQLPSPRAEDSTLITQNYLKRMQPVPV